MQKIQKQFSVDGISKERHKQREFDYDLAQFALKNKNSSVLFSHKYGRVKQFTTRDSKLYFTQKELKKIRSGERVEFFTERVDCVGFRYDRKKTYYAKKENPYYFELKERYSSLRQYITDAFRGYTHGIGLVRMWNISLVSSLIFGMFLMTMIYRYLGQGAHAQEDGAVSSLPKTTQVLGAQTTNQEAVQRERDYYTAKILAELSSKKNADFEKTLRNMVRGYPIEAMVPYIAKQDRVVAAFIVAIAKKESSWGVHAPVLDDQDCFNYWGFRKKTDRMGTGGHTCFNSRQEAVTAVANRINTLVYDEKNDTPEKMVSPWKCGYDCSWDSKQAVQKWIDDVDFYFRKIDTGDEVNPES